MNLYATAVYAKELCENLIHQKKPLPNKLEYLLADYLPAFFSYSCIFADNRSDGTEIWQSFEWILEHISKKANDFVEQELIDNLLKNMCHIHAVDLIAMILPSPALLVSPEVLEEVEKSKKEVQKTIDIAKKIISEKGYKDVKDTVGETSVVRAYPDEVTPCGKIGIFINLDGYSVTLLMYNNHKYLAYQLDITNECMEFKKNFFTRKH